MPLESTTVIFKFIHGNFQNLISVYNENLFVTTDVEIRFSAFMKNSGE